MAVEEARGRQLGAGRLSNPTVGVDTRNETYLSPGEVMMSLDQSFPITRRLRLEKQLTAQLVTAAELEVRDAERRLISEAQTLAVQILAIEQQRGLRQQQTELAKKLSEFVTGRAKAGELSALDAAQAQVDAQRLIVEARKLEGESRSLLGLARTGWRLGMTGTAGWTDGHGSFFVMGSSCPLDLTMEAWPGFRQTLHLQASTGFTAEGLRDEGDREAFRTWFVALLEQQLDSPSPAWEPAQRDCAGLLRFAFREALAPHTEAWRERVAFNMGPPGHDPSPAFAPRWRQGFPTPEGPQPFARGLYLRRLACVLLGRDLASARPGDLLFFARGGAHAQPDHAMAFVRPDADGTPMLLYHTGPEGSGASRAPGEVRRVRLDDLLHHPDPDFRPLSENPAFLGLYRWQLLAGWTDTPFLSRD